MVSKNVEIVLRTLKKNPRLTRELHDALQKVFDTAKVDLSDEEVAELFRTMTEAIIIFDNRKDALIIETKPGPQQTSYQKDMERGRKEGTLDFEMWLRHVKKLTGQTIFQMNCNPDPVMDRELREEYAKWKGKERNV